jgi:hypothetical protein
MALCALASVVTWAAVFLLPVFVQSVQGRSALVAGLAMAPQGPITGLSTVLAPRWLAGLTVRVTVPAGFAVLAVANPGAAAHRDGDPAVANRGDPGRPLRRHRPGRRPAAAGAGAAAAAGPARRRQHAVNTWQRIAGSFGIGLVAALYATRARTLGPVAALHSAGLVLVALAAVGALGALVLPVVRNTAMEHV